MACLESRLNTFFLKKNKEPNPGKSAAAGVCGSVERRDYFPRPGGEGLIELLEHCALATAFSTAGCPADSQPGCDQQWSQIRQLVLCVIGLLVGLKCCQFVPIRLSFLCPTTSWRGAYSEESLRWEYSVSVHYISYTLIFESAPLEKITKNYQSEKVLFFFFSNQTLMSIASGPKGLLKILLFTSSH